MNDVELTENQQLFLDALRSNEFYQGVGRLRDGSKTFCCLGVACEIYRRTTNRGSWQLNNTVQSFHDEDEDGNGFYSSGYSLTYNVSAWLGLPSGCYDPTITVNNQTSIASNHNDGGDDNIPRKTFAQIADGFEKLFKELNETHLVEEKLNT